MHAGVPPRWQLLKSRLEGICPTGTDTLQQLWRWRSMPKEQPAFLLQVRARCLQRVGPCSVLLLLLLACLSLVAGWGARGCE